MNNKYKVTYILIFIFFIFAFNNNGYESNSAVTQRELDGNTISTWFRTNGSFNRDPSTGNAGFEWPVNSGKTAKYVSGLWIGAQVDDDTLVSIAGYDYEYLTGYTDSSGNPYGFEDPVYRIYKLTLGVNDNDRLAWPNIALGNSDQGAPMFYDSLLGILKPLDLGAQTMFYLYSDSYKNAHGAQGGSTAPLKADIKQLNFAYNNSGSPLRNIIFSQFTIINRSTSTWNNAYFNIWTDDDLGNGQDDKIGCDSSLKMGYTYNGTNNDGIYGSNPPAVAVLLLKGALKHTGNSSDVVNYCYNGYRVIKAGYKDMGMSGFNQNGIPGNYIQSYRLMQGFTSSGGNIMHPSGYATKLYFTGNPETNTGWVQSSAGEQRFLLSSGPVDVLPGDTQIVTMAQIIERGENNINAISVLRQYANFAKEFYYDCYGLDPVGINENNFLVEGFSLQQNYPNPFNPETKIKYTVAYQSNVSIKVFDVLGNEVNLLINKKQRPGDYEVIFDGTNLSSGVYIYQMKAGNYIKNMKMLLVK